MQAEMLWVNGPVQGSSTLVLNQCCIISVKEGQYVVYRGGNSEQSVGVVDTKRTQ